MDLVDRSRRGFVVGGLWVAGLLAVPSGWAQEDGDAFRSAIRRIEQQAAGRLGVAVLDTANGRSWGYRETERFPMCSTFKMMLVAAVLWQADAELSGLQMPVKIPPQPLLGNSPSTAPHAGATMSLFAVCQAAVVMSDNTAANLLLERIGGPEGWTTFVRAMGDPQSRLDRTEPALNESKPGDVRDTTTPASMTANLLRIHTGEFLSEHHRANLLAWMAQAQTGLTCLRAGMPADWNVQDKTGSDGVTTRNEIALVYPGGRAPWLVSAYLTECAGPDEKRNAVLAQVGKVVAGLAAG